MSVNKTILIGNLGADPEVRHLESGKAVATFSLATNETWKDKEGKKQSQTEWHNVVLWSPLAEIAEKFLKKGKQVYIEGKNRTRSYEDKDGIKRYTTEVVGRNITLLGSQPGQNNDRVDSLAGESATAAPKAGEDYTDNPDETDDLPF